MSKGKLLQTELVQGQYTGKADSTLAYEAVIIGGSAGTIQALPTILSQLTDDFDLPTAIVLHRLEEPSGYLHQHLSQYCALPVVEVEDKEPFRSGRLYLAPPGYHLLLEDGGEFSLSIDPRVNYSRPSIDVLIESAVDVYANKLAVIILTGANSDGSAGIKKLKEAGGLVIVQNPNTASSSFMPNSAIKAAAVDYILDLDDIAALLLQLDINKKILSSVEVRRTNLKADKRG